MKKLTSQKQKYQDNIVVIIITCRSSFIYYISKIMIAFMINININNNKIVKFKHFSCVKIIKYIKNNCKNVCTIPE